MPSPSRRPRAGLVLLFALAVALATPPATARAQTNVGPGTVLNDTTWTVANGPYDVRGDLVIAAGATLTIEPGVQVNVHPTGAGGLFNNTEIVVLGRLVAQGTEAAPVSIQPTPPIAGHDPLASWAGIILQSAVGGSFDHVAISNAREAAIRATNTPLTVTRSSFSGGAGIRAILDGGASPAAVTVSNSKFRESTFGVSVQARQGAPAGEVAVDDNEAVDGQVGLALSSNAAGVNIRARRNRLQRNSAEGLRIESGGSAAFDIASNTIVGNGVGVLSTSLSPDAAALAVSASNIYGNLQADWRAENLSATRATVNAEGNYWGTGDTGAIDSHVFDGKDDPARATVDYTPFLTQLSATAPAPSPPDTTLSGRPPLLDKATSFSFVFSSNESASSFECKVDAGDWAPCTSPKAVTGLSDGSHTFQARALDAAGIADPMPASATWTVDTTAPQTTIDFGRAGASDSTSASFEFSADDPAARFECRLNGGVWAACSSPAFLTGLRAGSHDFEVRAIDPLQNTDPTPASRTFSVTAAARPDPAPATLSPAGPTLSAMKGALEADASSAAKALRRLGIGRLVRGRGFSARGLDALTAGRFAATLTGTQRGAGMSRRVILAKGSRPVSRAGRYTLRLRLTRAGKGLLRRDRAAGVALTLSFRDGSSRTVTVRKRTSLKR